MYHSAHCIGICTVDRVGFQTHILTVLKQRTPHDIGIEIVSIDEGIMHRLPTHVTSDSFSFSLVSKLM